MRWILLLAPQVATRATQDANSQSSFTKDMQVRGKPLLLISQVQFAGRIQLPSQFHIHSLLISFPEKWGGGIYPATSEASEYKIPHKFGLLLK